MFPELWLHRSGAQPSLQLIHPPFIDHPEAETTAAAEDWSPLADLHI